MTIISGRLEKEEKKNASNTTHNNNKTHTISAELPSSNTLVTQRAKDGEILKGKSAVLTWLGYCAG